MVNNNKKNVFLMVFFVLLMALNSTMFGMQVNSMENGFCEGKNNVNKEIFEEKVKQDDGDDSNNKSVCYFNVDNGGFVTDKQERENLEKTILEKTKNFCDNFIYYYKNLDEFKTSNKKNKTEEINNKTEEVRENLNFSNDLDVKNNLKSEENELIENIVLNDQSLCDYINIKNLKKFSPINDKFGDTGKSIIEIAFEQGFKKSLIKAISYGAELNNINKTLYKNKDILNILNKVEKFDVKKQEEKLNDLKSMCKSKDKLKDLQNMPDLYRMYMNRIFSQALIDLEKCSEISCLNPVFEIFSNKQLIDAFSLGIYKKNNNNNICGFIVEYLNNNFIGKYDLEIECKICFNNSDPKDFSTPYGCKHSICNECFNRCMKEKPSCPFCKKEINKK